MPKSIANCVFLHTVHIFVKEIYGMIIVMKNGATQEHITRLSGWLTDRFGVHVNPIYGTGTTVLALVGRHRICR